MPGLRSTLSTVAVLATASLTTTLPSARAQVDVDVAVDNVGGSRTLYVEDLTGQPVTDLDLGENRSMPFRVRVVDSTMDRTGFSVSASMTRLYRDNGGLEFSTFIPSSNVSLADPANPLNVQTPSALVQPVFDTVSSIADGVICALLTLPVVGGVCTINTAGLTGLQQTVPLPVDLGDLSGLPLLPQKTATGPFTNPSFGGVAASDPAAAGAPAATSRQLLSGAAVSDAAVLTNIGTQLDAVLAPLTTTQRVDQGVLTAALRDAVGVTWDLLSGAQITTVLNSTIATRQALGAGQVLAQSGTYLSFPLLQVSVPNGTAGGTFRGTLVITGLE